MADENVLQGIIRVDLDASPAAQKSAALASAIDSSMKKVQESIGKTEKKFKEMKLVPTSRANYGSVTNTLGQLRRFSGLDLVKNSKTNPIGSDIGFRNRLNLASTATLLGSTRQRQSDMAELALTQKRSQAATMLALAYDNVTASQKKTQVIGSVLPSVATGATAATPHRTRAELEVEWEKNRQIKAEQKRAAAEERESRWTAAREKKAADTQERTAARQAMWQANRERKADELRARKEEREARWAANRQRIADEKRLAQESRSLKSQQRREEVAAYTVSRKQASELRKDLTSIGAVQAKALGAPKAVQQQIAAILNAPGAQTARMGMVNVGATRQMAVYNQLAAGGIPAAQARYVAGLGGRTPGGWVPPGGPPGRNPLMRGLGRFASGLASGLGIGVGGYAAVNLAQAGLEDVKRATAYDRQAKAAEFLAGSQAKLNKLLETYGKASGGAVDKSTALANVTRLLATNYAKTAPELERFVKATRGASIALGKDQEYVIQETQLAISNTSQKRLDQIGLGIKEVTDRIEQLRAANKNWTRETAFQEAVLGLMEQKYGNLTKTVEGQATGLEKLIKAWKDYRLQLGQNAQGPVNSATDYLSKFFNYLEESNRERLAEMKASEPAKDEFLASKGFLNTSIYDVIGMLTGRTGQQVRVQRAIETGRYDRNLGPRGESQDMGGIVNVPSRKTEDQLSVMKSGFDQSVQLQKQYSSSILEETRSYNEQRANLIRNFEKNTLREEQDFARARARGLRDYERSIMDLMRDAQERDTEMQSDLDENLQEMRDDSNKRLAKSEKKYQEDREKDEKDHRDRMLKAAGQLDAIALLDERKAWKRSNQEKKKQHDEGIAEEKEALKERIDDALKAHAERLEDAHKADDKRLEDMRLARERQLKDEDEDRAIQKARAIEDHNDQLAEMDRQHSERMIQIKKEYDDQVKAFQDALMEDLANVGIYVAGYHQKMAERDKLMETWLENFILLMEKKLKDQAENGKYRYDPEKGPQIPSSYAVGGAVKQTGMALLHGGEFVLSKQMLAGGYVPPAIAGAINNSSRSINFGDGAIRIETTPGMEFMVADLVEERLIQLLESV